MYKRNICWKRRRDLKINPEQAEVSERIRINQFRKKAADVWSRVRRRRKVPKMCWVRFLAEYEWQRRHWLPPNIPQGGRVLRESSLRVCPLQSHPSRNAFPQNDVTQTQKPIVHLKSGFFFFATKNTQNNWKRKIDCYREKIVTWSSARKLHFLRVDRQMRWAGWKA